MVAVSLKKFFFQAEDGIRDVAVTGVQTCALPISICDMITATTDKQPIYLGKPSKEVVNLCLDISGFTPEETLVVGDRLYTDIACGINGGVDTCVLFTGEAQKKDILTPEGEPNTQYLPDYAFENVQELLNACQGEINFK